MLVIFSTKVRRVDIYCRSQSALLVDFCILGYLLIIAVLLCNKQHYILSLIFFSTGSVCCIVGGSMMMACYNKCIDLKKCTEKTLIIGLLLTISSLLMLVDCIIISWRIYVERWRIDTS